MPPLQKGAARSAGGFCQGLYQCRVVRFRHSVIPGEQRETRNPGGITTSKHLILLDASFRWHDEITHIRIIAMD
jgi:hypothetical protein